MIVQVIEYILGSYFLILVLYLLIFSIFGYFYKQRKYTNQKDYSKICTIIPSYKEDSVILSTVNNILEQNYPKNFFDVLIIADNLKKETLDQLKFLPISVLEVEFKRSSKSKSLKKALKYIQCNSLQYDYIFILDADNHLGKDVLIKVNECIKQNYDAIQVHRTAKNINTPIALLDAMSEEINNHIFRKGHRACGLSSALIGSGFGMNFDLFLQIMPDIESVGEDKCIEMELLKRNVKVEYLDDAFVFDEKTQHSYQLYRQRSRWIAAQFESLAHFLKLTHKKFLLFRNVDLFFKGIQKTIIPRIFIGTFLFFMAFFCVIQDVFFNIRLITLPYYWVSLFFLFFIAMIIAVPLKLLKYINLKLFFNLIKIVYLYLLALFIMREAQKNFFHTDHDFNSNH